MGIIAPQQASDNSTSVNAASINNPINTIANEFNGNIDNTNIKSGAAIATSKLASDAGVTGAMLSPSAIKLGYAQITSNFTTTSGTAVQVTGLTATVTIPAGGRSIKITAFAASIENNTVNQYAEMTIWDGTVGSGTQLTVASARSAVASQPVPATAIAIVTPAAGSKTYNVGFAAPGAAGTALLAAAATKPAFILIEAI